MSRMEVHWKNALNLKWGSLKSYKLIANMLTEEELERFYPQLISRILLYLRQQRYEDTEVLTEDLIDRFQKSKSIISQALKCLSERRYIKKEYINNVTTHGSRHKILITSKGMEIADMILSEGLHPMEWKVVEGVFKKLLRKKRLYRSK